MATQLSKPVTREVASKDGPLLVRLTAEGVMVRPKRQRKWYGPLGYSHILTDAALREADIMREAKGSRRPQRKALRVGL